MSTKIPLALHCSYKQKYNTMHPLHIIIKIIKSLINNSILQKIKLHKHLYYKALSPTYNRAFCPLIYLQSPSLGMLLLPALTITTLNIPLCQ